MGLELAKAYVSVGADSTGLARDFNQIQGQVTAGISRLGGLMGPAIAGIVGGAGLAGLLSVAESSVEEATKAQASYARLAAVLRATGNAAGYTTDQLAAYAGELQASTTAGDDDIMESMAILGTFKSVAGDVFKRATASALDLSATGFGSVASATTQLAKALEDPVRGLGALRRVGVSFSAEQERQIKLFATTNQVAKAQEIILEAVEGQVKGTAAALADTDAGKLQQVSNVLGDVKEELGAAILPLFIKFKELQVLVMQRIVDVVKWIGVLASNSGTTWELLQVQATLSVSRIWDIMTNLWQNLPTLAMASVKSMATAFSGFVEYTGLALSNLVELFKTTFMAIQGFWEGIFSGEGFGSSFDKAISQIGDRLRENAVAQFNKAKEVGAEVADTWSRETRAVDLMAMSERSRMLEEDRNKLVQTLVDARAAVDTKIAETKSETQVQAAPTPQETKSSIEAGRVGFAEFGQKIQDAMFKEQDQKTKKMISLMEAGNRIQEEQLAALKNPAPVVVDTGFLE